MKACAECPRECKVKNETIGNVGAEIIWLSASTSITKYRPSNLEAASPKAAALGYVDTGRAAWVKLYTKSFSFSIRSNKESAQRAFSGVDCYKQNQRMIVASKPKLVVLAGGSCLEGMLGVQKLAIADDATFGAVFSATFSYNDKSHTCWVAVTYPTSIKDRHSTRKFKIQQNKLIYTKILPALGFGLSIPPLPTVESVESIRSRVEVVHDADKVADILATFSDRVSLDVETNGLKAYPCIGHSPLLLTCAITDMRDERTIAFPVNHPRATIDKIKIKSVLRYYLSRWQFIVGHNMAFDVEWLHVFLGGDFMSRQRPVIECTQIAAMIKQGCNTALSMGWQTQRYLGYNVKQFRGLDITNTVDAPLDDLCVYNGSDTIITARLFNILIKNFSRLDMQVYKAHVAAVRPTVAMQANSYKIDHKELDTVRADFAEQAETALTKFKGLPEVKDWYTTHPDFLVTSPAQMAEMLITAFAIKLAKTATGKLSVSAAALKKYESMPVIKYYQAYCKYRKASGTFIAGILKHESTDGRVHARYNLCGTKTLRYSSSQPNFQNLSKRGDGKVMRRGLYAGEDAAGNRMCLIAADYGALENLCIAIASRDSVMADMIQNDVDTHRYFAHAFIQLDTDKSNGLSGLGDARKVKNVRQAVKMVVSFPKAYGAMAETVAKSGDCSLDVATKLCELYEGRYTGILRWQNRQYKQGSYIPVASCTSEQTGYTRRGTLTRNMCLNTPVQHAGAVVVLAACVRLYFDYRIELTGNIHDELTLACVNDDAIIAQCAAVQACVMVSPRQQWAHIVPMVAETEYGMNMLEMKHLADIHAARLGIWQDGTVLEDKDIPVLVAAKTFVEKGGRLQYEVCAEIQQLL